MNVSASEFVCLFVRNRHAKYTMREGERERHTDTSKRHTDTSRIRKYVSDIERKSNQE